MGKAKKDAKAKGATPEPPAPEGAAGAGGAAPGPGMRKASRLLECSIAPDKVARLADAQAETHLAIKAKRKALREYAAEKREEIAHDLARLDGLAEKVKHARFRGYVLCYETPGTDDKGDPVLTVRRADTDETWTEALPKGAQATIVADPPGAPEAPKSNAKRCICPLPEHAERGETWICPAEGHGHLWCNPAGEIEPVPWKQGASDPVEALGGEA